LASSVLFLFLLNTLLFFFSDQSRLVLNSRGEASGPAYIPVKLMGVGRPDVYASARLPHKLREVRWTALLNAEPHTYIA